MEEEEDGSFDDDDIDSEGGGSREAVLSLVRSHHTLRYAMMVVADRKSQVWQCLGFCTADFWSSLASESAAQKPKYCLT